MTDEEEDINDEIETLESMKRIKAMKIQKKKLEKEVGPLPVEESSEELDGEEID